MLKDIRIEIKKHKNVKNIMLVVLGALLVASAVKYFAQPTGLMPGGFTGLTFLILNISKEFFGIDLPYSIVYLALNLPVGLFVYNSIGKKFTVLSLLHVILTSLFTAILPSYCVTENIILAAIFGGIISAFGSVCALHANASTGGTDFIAIYFSNKLNRPMWDYVLVFNASVLLISGLLFSLDMALFSIIYQFANTQTIGRFHDRYKLMSLHIITTKPDEVSEGIMRTVRRGITSLEGKGVYQGNDKTLLFLIVNAYEAADIISVCKEMDEHIFISEAKVERVIGRFYQKPFE